MKKLEIHTLTFTNGPRVGGWSVLSIQFSALHSVFWTETKMLSFHDRLSEIRGSGISARYDNDI